MRCWCVDASCMLCKSLALPNTVQTLLTSLSKFDHNVLHPAHTFLLSTYRPTLPRPLITCLRNLPIGQNLAYLHHQIDQPIVCCPSTFIFQMVELVDNTSNPGPFLKKRISCSHMLVWHTFWNTGLFLYIPAALVPYSGIESTWNTATGRDTMLRFPSSPELLPSFTAFTSSLTL